MYENNRPKINSEAFKYYLFKVKKHISQNFNPYEYKWFTDYSESSFDHVSFKYKNQIFSIILDVQFEAGISAISQEIYSKQIEYANKYNLIPCKFPIVISKNSLGILNNLKGFNLYHTETNEEIIPDRLAIKGNTKISDYELNVLLIKEVLKFLNSKNIKILSYRNQPDESPQIWLADEHDVPAWLVINNKLEYEKNLEHIKNVSEKYKDKDGYLVEYITKSSVEKTEFEILNFEKVCTVEHSDITKENIKELIFKSLSKKAIYLENGIGVYPIPYYEDFLLKISVEDSFLDNIKNSQQDLEMVPFKYEENIIQNKSLGLYIYHIAKRDEECIKRGYAYPQEFILRKNKPLDIIRKVSGEIISNKFENSFIKIESESSPLVAESQKFGRKSICKVLNMLKQGFDQIEENFIGENSSAIKFLSGSVYYQNYNNFISLYLEYLHTIANFPQESYDNAVRTIFSAKCFALDFIHTYNTLIDYEKKQFNFIDFIFDSNVFEKIRNKNQLNHFRGLLLGFHLLSFLQPTDCLFYQEHIDKFEKYHKMIVEKINKTAPDDKKIKCISIDNLKKELFNENYENYKCYFDSLK